MLFKIVIAGRTPQELKANVREYLGLDKEPVATEPEEQEDFLTQAAERGSTLRQPSLTSQPSPSPAAPFPSQAAHNASGSETISPSHTGDGVDSKGLPWDERIHAATGAKNKDGSWKRRRGVEDRDVYAVEQELIAKIKSGAVPTASVGLPAVPGSHAPTPVAPAVQLAVVPPIPAAPSKPTPPPPPAELPHAHSLETFKKTLIPLLAKLTRDGKITAEWVQTLKKHLDVDEIYNLNDEQMQWLFEYFVEYKLIERV